MPPPQAAAPAAPAASDDAGADAGADAGGDSSGGGIDSSRSCIFGHPVLREDNHTPLSRSGTCYSPLRGSRKKISSFFNTSAIKEGMRV